MRESSEERALSDPLSHSVDAEGRYWDHGGAPSLGAHQAQPVEAMPHPPGEGTLHELLSGSGARALFQWAQGAWHVAAERMSRMAYSPAWLASRGWRYERAVVPDVELNPSSDPIVTDVALETDAAPVKARAKKDPE